MKTTVFIYAMRFLDAREWAMGHGLDARGWGFINACDDVGVRAVDNATPALVIVLADLSAFARDYFQSAGVRIEMAR